MTRQAKQVQKRQGLRAFTRPALSWDQGLGSIPSTAWPRLGLRKVGSVEAEMITFIF